MYEAKHLGVSKGEGGGIGVGGTGDSKECIGFSILKGKGPQEERRGQIVLLQREGSREKRRQFPISGNLESEGKKIRELTKKNLE